MTLRTYRALLVANSTFPNDPHNLPELEGPRNDPALLRDALCDRDAGLVPSDNIRLVTERTMSEVLREVEDFLSSGTRNDTLILYYSGHGVLDQSNELFLCTRDTRSDRLRSTAVKASDVRQMIDETAAATTVVLLDCCHSGRFKGGDVPGTFAGRGRFVITSSRSGELANDTDVRNHASLFTHHLVEGMVGGAEDRDGDGVVNLSELYEYVHQALTTSGRQVPQKRFEGDGDVPIALRTSTTTPHPRPELLDPVLVAPQLDVPTTEIDLGEVDADVVLPPERVSVVNRGGGTLEWTFESSASWITAERHGNDLVLELHPVPGPNRANVYIRDTGTDAVTTVRVSVRVRPSVVITPEPVRPSTPPAEKAPAPAEEDLAPVEEARLATPSRSQPRESKPKARLTEDWPAPVAPTAPIEPAPVSVAPVEPVAPGAAGHRTLQAWVAAGAGAIALVAGVLMVYSALDAVDALYTWTAETTVLVLRYKDARGVLPQILGGLTLAFAGLVALLRRGDRRDGGLGVALTLGVVLGIERFSYHEEAMAACDCVGASTVLWFNGAGLLALAATAAAAIALGLRRRWQRASWLPAKALGGLVGLILVLAVLNTQSLFRYYDAHFGPYAGGDRPKWYVMITIAVLAGIVAATRLSGRAGPRALAGALAMPVFFVVAEVVYAAGVVDDDGYSVWAAWILLILAVALVATAIIGSRHRRRMRPGSSAEAPATAA